MQDDVIVTFAKNTRGMWLVIHILSTVIGLGGATVADMLFFRFLSDYRMSRKEVEVLNFLASVIVGGIVALIVSGAFLYLTNVPVYLAKPAFLLKMTAVAVISLNGFALHLFITPRLLSLSFMHEQGAIPRGWRRLAFALGSISVCSWYTAFFVAMLKQYLPYSYAPMLGVYMLILLGAIAVSQVVEARIARLAALTEAALLPSGPQPTVTVSVPDVPKEPQATPGAPQNTTVNP